MTDKTPPTERPMTEEKARRRRQISMFGHSITLPANPTLRIGLGIAFCIGGLFAILPVLGLWMIPMGLAVLSVDIPWVRRHSARAAVALRRRFPRLGERIFPRER